MTEKSDSSELNPWGANMARRLKECSHPYAAYDVNTAPRKRSRRSCGRRGANIN
jgi:hypothetical protein